MKIKLLLKVLAIAIIATEGILISNFVHLQPKEFLANAASKVRLPKAAFSAFGETKDYFSRFSSQTNRAILQLGLDIQTDAEGIKDFAGHFKSETQTTFAETKTQITNDAASAGSFVGGIGNQIKHLAINFWTDVKAPYLAAADVIAPSLNEQKNQADKFAMNFWNGLADNVGMLDKYARNDFGSQNYSLNNEPASFAVIPELRMHLSSIRKTELNDIALRNNQLDSGPPVVARNDNQKIGQVLGVTTSAIDPNYIDKLIDNRFNQYLIEGKFKGQKDDKGESGLVPGFSGPNGMVNNDYGKTTSVIGGTPITSYIPSTQSNGNSGGSLAGVTYLSSKGFTADTAKVNETLNVTGAATLASALSVSGNTTISGTFSAATSTLSSLTVSGSVNLTGSTTIAGLTVTGLNPGLTAGSVVFQGASGLAEDNSNFYWDDTNNRLGLGTTTPAQLLTVVGNAFITGNVNLATLTSSSLIMSDSGKNLSSVILGSGLSFNGNTLNTTQTMGAWTVGNGLIYNATSTDLIGIGTTSPSATLFVQGKGGVNPFAIASSSGSTLLTLTQAGNVGIGTTSPNNLIQVYDLVSFSNVDSKTLVGYQAGKYDLGQLNTYIGYQAGSANNSTGKTATADSNTGVGWRSLYSNTTGYFNTAVGYGSLSNNTSGYENTALGLYTLYSNSDGFRNSATGYGALYYNTSGDDNTAVGHEAGRFLANGASPNQTSGTSVYLGRSTKAYADGGANEIVIGYNAIGAGSNTVVLGNDSIDKTILKGNVGIGTSTVAARLVVQGSGSDIFSAFDSTGNGKMVITNQGNVGIGTTSPAYTLDVNGNLRAGTSLSVGINIETLSANKTLTSGVDKMYQWLSGLAYRTITLATSTARSGDRFVIRYNDVSGSAFYLQIYQGTTVLDYIYSQSTREYIFDGTNWVSGNVGTSISTDRNVSMGYSANSYNSGTAIGYNANAYDYGTAIGYSAWGPSSGVAVGSSANGNTSGAAVGYSASGYNYGTAVGYGTNGVSYGAAVGSYTNGSSYGAAVGFSASGYNYGAAVGNYAKGMRYGAALGYYAGNSIDTGADRYNTVIGAYSGYRINTGLGNTMLGYGSGYDATYAPTTGSYNILLGYNAWTPANTTSNFLNIGGLIFGTNLSTTTNAVSSGNVGIGTTSPNANLQIIDTSLNAPATSGSGAIGGLRISSAGSLTLDIGVQGNANPVYNWIQSRNKVDYSVNYPLAINPNGGNVGVGTTSPNTNLYVQGSSGSGFNVATFDMTSAGVNSKVVIGANSTRAGLGTLTNTDFALGTNNSFTQLYLQAGGNVGIGTITPTTKLEVYDGNDGAGGVITAKDGGAILMANNTVAYPLQIGNNTSGANSVRLRVDVNGMIDYSADTVNATPKINLGSGQTFAILGGNVGIGTTAPLQLLSVAGNMRLTGALFDSNNASGTLGMVLQSTGTGQQWVATSSLGISGGSLSGGTTGKVAVWSSPTALTSGTLIDNGTVSGVNATSSSYTFNIQGSSGVDPFQITSSTGTSLITVTQTGNVGIGTTTPSYPLVVQGNAQIAGTNTLYFGNTTQRTINFDGSNFKFYFASGNLVFNTNAMGLMTLTQNLVGIGTSTPAAALSVTGRATVDPFDISSTTGTSLLRVTKGGNVGIGTTTPAQQFVVVGDARITGALFDSNNASGTAGMILQTTGTGTQWVATSSLGISGGSLSGGTTGKVAVWSSPTALTSGTLIDNGTVAGINATSSSYTFNIQGTSGVNPFQITSSTGTSLVTVDQRGNVGIGSSTPGYTLSVGGSFRVAGASAGVYLDMATAGNAGYLSVGSANSNNGGFKIDVGGSTKTQFNVNGASSNTFQIKNNKGGAGMVDIMTMTNSNSVTNGSTGFGSTSPSATFVIQGQAGNTNDILRVASSTNDVYFSVTQAGNVGIGTTNPTKRLVVGDITGQNTLRINGLVTADMAPVLSLFRSGDTESVLAQVGSKLIFANTGGTTYSDATLLAAAQMVLLNNGNVGIGTTTPQQALQVIGNVSIGQQDSANTSRTINLFSDNAAANVDLSSINFIRSRYAPNQTAASLTFAREGNGDEAAFHIDTRPTGGVLTERFRVTSTGLVGIGTSSPAAGLHIGSAASGKNVRIANGWLCVDDNDTCTGATTAGNIYMVGAAITSGADVAENYPTNDSSLEAGDVVAADTGFPIYVSRATSSSPILGIISTKPGVLLNGYKSQDFSAASTVPVALAGRVPVKVSSENGNIAIGDYLAPSKLFPGYAMKATEPGQVFGRALENFNSSTANDQGKILVFIQFTYYQPTVAEMLQNGQNMANSELEAWLQSLTNINQTQASAFGDIVVTGSLAIQKDLTVKGVIYAAELKVDNITSNNITSKKVTTDELCLDNQCVTPEEFKIMLEIIRQQKGLTSSSPSPSPAPTENTPSTTGMVAGTSTPPSEPAVITPPATQNPTLDPAATETTNPTSPPPAPEPAPADPATITTP